MGYEQNHVEAGIWMIVIGVILITVVWDDFVGACEYLLYTVFRIVFFPFHLIGVTIVFIADTFFKPTPEPEPEPTAALPPPEPPPPPPFRFEFPYERLYEHLLLTARSGGGKTQTLEAMIIQYLKEGMGMIVMDSQEQMIDRLLTLEVMNKKEVLYISPLEPLQINLFDFGLERMGAVDEETRTRILRKTRNLCRKILGELLGSEITRKQQTPLTFLTNLVMVIPNATIYTLIDFCDNPDLVDNYSGMVDEETRKFLATKWKSKDLKDTREQISTKLWNILGEVVFAKFFTAKKNLVRIDQAMRRGAIILINTASSFMGDEDAKIFGKFFLGLIEQEIAERRTKKPAHPYLLVMDEAFEYFGGDVKSMLIQARKSFVGLVMAHHFLDQIPRELEGAFDVGIRMVTNIKKDIPAFAKLFDWEPYEFKQLKRVDGNVRWGLQISGEEARIISVPLGQLDKEPKRSDEEVKAFRKKNRERYGIPGETAKEEKPNSEKLWKEYHKARAKEEHEKGIEDVEYEEIKDPLPRIAPSAEDPTV